MNVRALNTSKAISSVSEGTGNAENNAMLLEEDDKPLIEPGVYAAIYESHSIRKIHGAGKLEIRFTILDEGAAYGKSVSRYYNVTKKPKGFKVGKCSRCARELAKVLRFNRLDRIPVSELRNQEVVVKVKTVQRGSDQKLIPESLRYSVIEEILGFER